MKNWKYETLNDTNKVATYLKELPKLFLKPTKEIL